MKTHQSGFTLLELLVVIAIIVVLAGLMFPAISKIQEKGRIATCVSNLKQLHTATMSYVTEHDGYLPHTASEEWVWVHDNGAVDTGVHTGWVDWYSQSDRKTYWWNEKGDKGLACVTHGVLFDYLGDEGDEKTYVCPSMTRAAKSKYGSKDLRRLVTRSYGMNGSLQNGIWAKRYYNIDGPSRVLMFAEQGLTKQAGYVYALENSGNGWNDPKVPEDTEGHYVKRSARNHDGCIDWRGKQNWSPCGGDVTTYEHIGEYHDGRGNCVFCDGHVERIEYDNTRFICSGGWEDGKPIGGGPK